MHTTTVHPPQEINQAWLRLIATYRSLASLTNGMLTIRDDRSLLYSNVQAIHEYKPESDIENLLHQQVLRYVLKAEQHAPGSLDVCLECIIDPNKLVQLSKPLSDTVSHPRPLRDSIKQIIARYLPTSSFGSLSNIIFDAYDLSGQMGKIIVEKASTNRSNVEHVLGNAFPLAPTIDNGLGVHHDIKVICIDGFIENVSEIHSLFEQIASSGQTCLMFVRGMADDVRHTIKVNYDRGKMKIIPVVVRFDLDGINTLVDIATICGGDLVSTLQGSLISMTKLESHPSISRVDVSRQGITIYNPSTKRAVDFHIHRLMEKRSEMASEMVEIIDDRLKTLVGSTTFVRIPNDHRFIANSQAIDRTLRAIKMANDYGIDHGDESMPALVNVVAVKFANQFNELLRSLGGAITSTDSCQS